jgi:hypothetical protein
VNENPYKAPQPLKRERNSLRGWFALIIGFGACLGLAWAISLAILVRWALLVPWPDGEG